MKKILMIYLLSICLLINMLLLKNLIYVIIYGKKIQLGEILGCKYNKFLVI